MRLTYVVEWYDKIASLIRQFQLVYYPGDSTVEMVELKNRKLFLKRTKVDGLKQSELYVGNTVNVLSRQLNVVSLGDETTKRLVGSQQECTFGMVKPDAVGKFGEILDAIHASGFTVNRLRLGRFVSRRDAGAFYEEHASKPFFAPLMDFILSGRVLIFELRGDRAVERWRALLGPTDSNAARREAPGSIRARHGTDNQANAAHGSDSLASAARELSLAFGNQGQRGVVQYDPEAVARRGESSLVLIKPHAVLSGDAGRIVQYISSPGGFHIVAAELFHLDRTHAEDFYEVYKGVVAEYPDMVVALSSGPLLALQVTRPASECPNGSVVQAFRELAGPADPEIARHLRPRSLRALFGKDKVLNAVHCTDLPEDGPLELDYFFSLLSH